MDLQGKQILTYDTTTIKALQEYGKPLIPTDTTGVIILEKENGTLELWATNSCKPNKQSTDYRLIQRR